MKARIIGSIFVLAILVALFILTGGLDEVNNSSTPSEQVAPSNPVSDNAFKDLKIN